MRFGVFSVVDHYPAELPRTSGQFFGELLEQAEAAEQLGFDSFWVAEHHFHEYGAIPSPAVWLAAAAQRTRRIRLGSAVVVLPFRNPLQVAEDYAMVDVLSGGRLNLGVGSGYLRHEFEGFGVRVEDKRERFDEALDVVLRAWTGERFSYDGRFHTVRDVQLNVVPVQRPRPPVWIAVLRNEAAPHVGKRGFPMMMIPYATTERIDELAETVAGFRGAFADAGGDPRAASVPFGLHAYCSDSLERATAEAKPAMDRYVRTRLYARQRPYELLVEKSLIAFGSPEDVIRVARRYEQAGLTDFLAITNFGGLEHARVLRSMELLAKHVLPAFGGSAR
ncbi:MAG: LLM class flavin-dependent oxidoreductase [Candidatus Rokubacteria bacterium]|nr:LLM class flavin-dependent oxidoreductase [Candidatus Rokubacteria bacterium]MBI2490941.1 LLM class flavin-dependent oxidoreductase [Candidatus Rokubacteria bacterium]